MTCCIYWILSHLFRLLGSNCMYYVLCAKLDGTGFQPTLSLDLATFSEWYIVDVLCDVIWKVVPWFCRSMRKTFFLKNCVRFLEGKLAKIASQIIPFIWAKVKHLFEITRRIIIKCFKGEKYFLRLISFCVLASNQLWNIYPAFFWSLKPNQK